MPVRRGAAWSTRGQRGDWLAVDRAATPAAAQHAALNPQWSATIVAVHHSTIHNLADQTPAHQARQIGLNDAPIAK